MISNRILGLGVALVTLTNCQLAIDMYRDKSVQEPQRTDKPCGDLVLEPITQVNGQYQASIRIAGKNGMQEFPFTWTPERTDLTALVEQAVVAQAHNRLLRRTFSWRELYAMTNNEPQGWLEVTCEDAKLPCEAKALRSSCWE